MGFTPLKIDIKKSLHSFELDAKWSAQGSITCLFGYTGSGKSLTLKMIAGLMKPDSGKISLGERSFFDSEQSSDLPPQKRDIGYVFQHNLLFPHMTVYGNIIYGMNGDGNSKKEKVRDIIKVMRLETLENKYPHEISGGQQQRTAIARAIMREPKLLLLDEPFNSLDHAVRKKMHKDLLKYQQYFKIPIILVTHDMDELHTLADWVVLYNDGKVVQTGTPDEVFNRPACRIAARLVGAKNIFDGTVKSVADGIVEVETELEKFRAMTVDDFSIGDKVVCCMRPEHIEIIGWGRGDGDEPNVFYGSIVDYISGASSYDVYFKLSNDGYDFEIKVASRDFSELKLQRGMNVGIRVDKSKVRLIKG